MKTFLITLLLICFALPAFAAPQTVKLFSNLSTSGTSASVARIMTVNKSVVVQGYTNAKAAAALDGTVTIQCAPSLTGPYNTVKDRSNTALAVTTNGVYNVQDACTFVRATFTRTSGNVSVWILGM